MNETAKSLLLLAGVGIIALILTWTDALSPSSDPPPTTTVATAVAPAAPPAAAVTTTTIDPETLVPAYLRATDDDVLVAPQARHGVRPCTEPALRGSLASVVVTRSEPDQRRFILRVTNDSTSTCAIELGLDLGFVTATDDGEARLDARRINPPPGRPTRFSYRDPVLEPGTSARFSVIATAVEFVDAGEAVTAISIEGRDGVLVRVDLPGIRAVAATDWYGPISGSGTPLDPASFLVPLPAADTPSCDPTSTHARVPPDAEPTDTHETPVDVTNDSAVACALPADIVLGPMGTDSAEIARIAPTSGTYVAPVIPAGGGIRLMVVGAGEPTRAEERLALRFPNGEEVVVDTDVDASFPPAVGWYGPVETTADDR